MLKLDFTKAFDSVSWDFLLSLLHHRGFPPKFITWIRTLLSTASSSILINGTHGTSFQHKKGLRQGDPISPYLFIIVVDVLARMCDAASTSIDVSLSSKLNSPFTIFQYADDTLIFATVKGQAIQKLNLLLDSFSRASGLSLNKEKSIFVPINLDATHINSVQNTLGFTLASLPIVYLGMSLNCVAPDRAAFMPLMQKFTKRCDGWRAKMLSKAGKLQLCKSILSTLPIYHMSCFKLPAWLIKDIDKMRRSFIWSNGDNSTRGISLVSWSLACLPKSYGGLGISDIRLQNLSLLTRWWWRLYCTHNGIWKETATKIFPTARNVLRPVQWRKTGSFFWTVLHNIKYIFQFSTSWQIGNGQRITFWTDDWGCGNLSLSLTQPYLASTRLLHCSLNLAQSLVLRNLNRPFDSQWSPIATRLQSILLSNTQDVIKWKWTSTSTFTTASLYKLLVTAGKSRSPLTKPWKYKLTPSIQLFCFFFLRNRLLTQQRLHKWNISVMVGCSLCTSRDIETPQHLFFTCPYSTQVWLLLHYHTGLLPPSLTPEQPCSDTFLQLINNSTPQIGKHKAQTFTSCTLWCLWKERNNRTFRGKRRSAQTTLIEIMQCAKDCLKNC